MFNSIPLLLHGGQDIVGEEIAPVVHNQRMQQLIQGTLDVRRWSLSSKHVSLLVNRSHTVTLQPLA